MDMKVKRLFNPDASDDIQNRKMINGETTNIIQLNSVKYKWAVDLYKLQLEQFWIPESIDLSNDIKDYQFLTRYENKAFKGILSFLVFLDSLQTSNLPRISDYITSPEVSLCLSAQQFFESIHSKSYQTIFETIVPPSEIEDIYYFWRNDKILLKRIEFIAKIYQDFSDNPNSKNFSKVLFGNYLLESIYFYNGFQFFYSLASRGKMIGTSSMIRLIQKDEQIHIVIFEKIIDEMKKENTFELNENEIVEMMKIAVEQEIKWSNHIIGNNILGISESTIENYTKYLANKRMKSLGYRNIYPESIKNPYQLFEMIGANDGSNIRENFFESTVTSYNHESSIDGWNF